MKILCLLLCVLLCGCVSRRIDIPGWGTYRSNMNAELENVVLEITKDPDTGVTTVKFSLGHSISDPATTIDAQATVIQASIQAGMAIAQMAAKAAVPIP